MIFIEMLNYISLFGIISFILLFLFVLYEYINEYIKGYSKNTHIELSAMIENNSMLFSKNK